MLVLIGSTFYFVSNFEHMNLCLENWHGSRNVTLTKIIMICQKLQWANLVGDSGLVV